MALINKPCEEASGHLHKAEVSDLAEPFFNLRDEIHIANGVACIGQRLIVPIKLEKEMLERMHESHL